jgi:rhamnogalacturonan endolyase
MKVRFIEDQVHGVSGNGVGAYMVIPGVSYEASESSVDTFEGPFISVQTSSGGPFFRGTLN